MKFSDDSIPLNGATLLVLTQDHISAGIVHEEHGLVVGLLLPPLQHLVQIVNGPGPFHQLCPCLLKPTLHKKLFCQTVPGCLEGIHEQFSAAVQCIALEILACTCSPQAA